jgi:ATP-dependent Clp protease protease subunit
MTHHDTVIHEQLLEDRIIFLSHEVSDAVANSICGQLLLLAAEDPVRDIHLWINSPGGSINAGLAIYDTMQFVRNDVSTVAIGAAASMAQLLLCGGARGKRFALPHARILMHQPLGSIGGTAANVAIQAENILHAKRTVQRMIARHTGRPVEQIEADSDRDRWFTARQALTYGLIDRVISGTVSAATEVGPDRPASRRPGTGSPTVG